MNEGAVKTVKGLQDRYATNYEETLSQRALRAHNVVKDIKEDYLDSLLLDNLSSSGSHSTAVLKEDDIEELRYLFIV